MSQPECLDLCPHITECRERLIVEMQTPAATSDSETTAKLDALVNATARVAVAACTGPQVEQRTVEKGGYFQSKKPVVKAVYACGGDGYAQQMAFYYQKDKMPR
jgi:hypothetical protein